MPIHFADKLTSLCYYFIDLRKPFVHIDEAKTGFENDTANTGCNCIQTGKNKIHAIIKMKNCFDSGHFICQTNGNRIDFN